MCGRMADQARECFVMAKEEDETRANQVLRVVLI